MQHSHLLDIREVGIRIGVSPENVVAMAENMTLLKNDTMHGDTAKQDACSCSCAYEHGVQWLARHPLACALFARFGRSRLADWLMGFLAGRLASRCQADSGDVRTMLDRYIGDASSSNAEMENPDCEFFNAFFSRPENCEGVARFVQSLASLDPSVRRGLLKTWLHAVVFSATIRKARHLRHGHGSTSPPRPMDAIVAHSARCNLCCQGCYTSNALGGNSASRSELNYIVDQLQRMNVFHVVLVGKGEPFYDEAAKQAMFDVVRRHPQMFFTVYSNGTNISLQDIRRLKTVPNLFPVLSIDGPEDINDRRRGPDVYRKVVETFGHMQWHGLLFGFISTVYVENRSSVLAPDFVGQMAAIGCRLGIYSLFVSPDHAPAREMMLSPEQREVYFADLRQLSASSAIPLIDIDALEMGFGCRAKRGATLYIDALTGQVAPCVRRPYSPDSCNIYEPSHRHRLSEILASPFFRDYRGQSAVLPCDAFREAEGEVISVGACQASSFYEK